MVLKLFHNAGTDGVAYIDIPISGTIVSIHFVGTFLSGAGGAGYLNAEVSRSPVNQVTTNNPRGVLAQATFGAAAASQRIAVNVDCVGQGERVMIGERLYLNCGSYGDLSSIQLNAFLNIA